MRVIFHDNIFYCLCGFDNRVIPKTAGFTWDEGKRVWYTSRSEVAARLRQYLDEAACLEVDNQIIRIEPWSKPLSVIAEKKLYSFQNEAALFALSRNRSYLGLDPGLGKTAVAVTCHNSDPGPVLYITPPFLKYNVETEFKAWSILPLQIELVDPQDISVTRWKTRNVLVLPDSVCHRPEVVAALNEMSFHWLFIDEAHRFKNQEAMRTMAVLGAGRLHKLYTGLYRRSKRVVAMSGTPMPNRPIELFPILKHLAPETIGYRSFFQYAQRYCNARRTSWGWDNSGESNLPELAQNLRGKFMIRMKKKDVLKELPPKTEQIIFLEKQASKKLRDMEDHIQLENQMKAASTIRQILREVGDGPQGAEYRRILGEEKAPQAAKYIKDLLENDEQEKMLIFAWHRSVIEILTDELFDYQPYVITGETPHERRHEYVKAFQKPGSKARVFLGNIEAMGVGLTLTAAKRVVFAEYSWVPAQNEQAADRIHRIGQKDNVLIQFLALRESLDVRIIHSLLSKQRMINQVVG